MRLIKRLSSPKQNFRGDTIVEVLIAIAIAGFAIGVSYATAQRSLKQSITAQEHNEALNIIERQVNDLRVRFQGTSASSSFASTFANSSPGQADYCLDDTGVNPATAATWNPYHQTGAVYGTAFNTSSY